MRGQTAFQYQLWRGPERDDGDDQPQRHRRNEPVLQKLQAKEYEGEVFHHAQDDNEGDDAADVRHWQ